MPEFRMIDVGGVRLRAAVEGTGPLVVMVHGFPESWYSWRHQIGPIAAAGFTAAAIDVRGYGGSDRPPQVADYAMNHMVADVTGVVDALSPGAPAVILGHDWGAPIVWNTALIRPDRIRAVGALSVPYLGPAPKPFNHIFDEVFTKKNRFFYQAYFQKEGVAEAEAEGDVRTFLRKFLYAISGDAPVGSWPTDKTTADPLLKGLIDPEPFPAWLTPADLDYYVGEFERSGLRGPINRYRNHEADFAYLQDFRERKIEQPALFISGTRDPAYNMLGGRDPMEVMRTFVPNLQVAELLEGCGHWTQQERPDEVNARLIPWLKSL
ncbi:alpha/beta fold hydrolase [Zavarzinia sp. CC-PAN008]|uniref:alpha/beta fold hydrolase n=1 Tax=Zavarzinia sp. CC-PAN008 TaxID=3243332 RepID=UPI003F743FC9